MGQAQANPVLIADDFAAFRRLLRAKLQEIGFQTVVEASDGVEAVAKAAELQPLLVLLDLGMPNLDGLRAATQIRSLAPESKVLFISLNNDPDIVRSALSDGAAGFLCKSRINNELIPAIEAVFADKKFVCSNCPTESISLAGRGF